MKKVLQDSNFEYESVSNEIKTANENIITNRIQRQGISETSDSATIVNNKYFHHSDKDSIIDLHRFKHISSIIRQEKVIIGNDNRCQVLENEFPYKIICLLLIKDKFDHDYFGTGFFISKTCVITAGHCVFFEKNWAKEIKVIPGANGNMPHGYAISNNFRSVQGWTKNEDENFDHGAIILHDNNLFNQENSYFDYKSFENEMFIEISGYPSDKNGTQWKSEGTVYSSNTYKIFYELDTVQGNSGSPVFIKNGNNRLVVGIHTFGDIPNHSIRVNQEIINRWSEWSNL